MHTRVRKRKKKGHKLTFHMSRVEGGAKAIGRRTDSNKNARPGKTTKEAERGNAWTI